MEVKLQKYSAKERVPSSRAGRHTYQQQLSDSVLPILRYITPTKDLHTCGYE